MLDEATAKKTATRRAARRVTSVVFRVAILALAMQPNAALSQPAEDNADDGALDALRGREPVGAEDMGIIDGWIERQIQFLRAEPGDLERATQVRTRFLNQINNADNDPAFVAAFASRTAQAVSRRMGNCAELDPLTARTLVRILNRFDRTEVVDGLTAALNCEARSDVRYLAARGFVQLRPNIETNPVLTGEVIAALRQAGEQEKEGLVAAQLYQAIQFETLDRQTDTHAAMLDVFAKRLEWRDALPGGPVRDGGEIPALKYFEESRPTDQEQVERLVALLAKSLRLDVERFDQEGVDELERYRLVVGVDAAERMLAAIVRPSPTPSVRNAMSKEQDVRTIEMKLELNKWIGTEETPGILNQSPWDVPVGAP